MWKKLLLAIVTLACILPLSAHTVDENRARAVATTLMRHLCASQDVEMNLLKSDIGGGLLYIFTREAGGFVVVAGDDRARAILAYSATERFDQEDVPDACRALLEGYANEIATMIKRGDEASTTVRYEWNMLVDGKINDHYETAVAPMLTTQWNQGTPYNKFCPIYDSSNLRRVPTGCVATAMAQVMKYWNHPTVGFGSSSMTSRSYGTMSADYSATTYEWDKMPARVTFSSSDEEQTAVATLMYHCGISVYMAYGPSGSAAMTGAEGSLWRYCAENALKAHFGYSGLAHTIRKENMDDAQWCSLLTNELDASRPILYAGNDTNSGHAFVLDGYNSSSQFHVNWGWGGSCDAFYTMGSLNPSSSGAGGNSTSSYNLNNSAVIGIEPITNRPSQCTITGTSQGNGCSTITGTGTYNFGDTASIVAEAEEGYRFERWTDGAVFNPRTFNVTCDASFTAIYKPTADKILRLGGESYYNSTGNRGNEYHWGIRYMPADMRGLRELKYVQIYAADTGNYTLTVGSGEQAPSTVLLTQQVRFYSYGWQTIRLTSSVSVPNGTPLWVTFSNIGVRYPAAIGNYSGRMDSKMCSYDGQNWRYYGSTYSFMIRAIFDTDGPLALTEASAPSITIFPNPTHGTVNIDCEEEISTIVLLNSSGQRLHTWSKQNTIDLSTFAPGIYTLFIKSSSNYHVGKIIKL